MIVKRRSFHIIACPVGVCSPHTHLVVSGRGVPHEPLTLFYEELQKSCTPGTLRSIMGPLLSFFSFLEEPQSSHELTFSRMQEEGPCCMEALEASSLPTAMTWAAPASEIQAAVRFYLAARWGCHTKKRGRYEDLHLSPSMQGEHQIHRFLAALQRFYRFAIERQFYWYEGNPTEAFRLPLRSRLLHAIAFIGLSLRLRPTRNQRKVAEVIREWPVQTVRETRDKVPILI